MSEQVTDKALVERVQKGDKSAFNILVVRYQNKVAGLVSRYVPQADVSDVAQESFIKAYRALASFRGDSAFYLMAVPYCGQHGKELSGCSG